jgi:hypothetical protein
MDLIEKALLGQLTLWEKIVIIFFVFTHLSLFLAFVFAMF